ncbi:sialidase family protein [Niabella insulamsoli]|uniref:sialidase family protein n=1 Tax=Niabella insulamsoli TaxID=3144874 RepID=UPI0031FC707F
MKKNFIILAFVASILALLSVSTGCYKEQHFDMPGPFEDTSFVNVVDSLPFPFDTSRQAGVWLMKDNVPDYEKILFKGFTDYKPMNDTLSWLKESTGVRLRPHRNYYPLSDADHLGGNPNSYQFNWVISKYFVPIGEGKSFYMYAKATIGTFSGTAAGLVLGTSWETGDQFVFGMDGFSNIAPTFFVDLYGTTISVNPDQGWPTVNEAIVPGVPADIEVVIHNYLFYVKINGTLCFTFRMPRGRLYYFTPMIRPWRNFITMHDFYIESNDMFSMDYAMHEYEQGYSRLQAPALTKASNGNLLLFAEGRSNPGNAFERVAQNTMPAGNTDIVMKRSTDNGSSWDDQMIVIAGEDSDETYGFPQVVSTADGKIILHYSKLNTNLVNGSISYLPEQTMYQTVSTDNGQSWSTPVDITASLADVPRGYLKSSSAHGIELATGTYKNRLVMPVVYGGKAVKVAFSDDHGASWQTGAVLGGSNNTAGSVVELADSRLMLVLTHGNASPQSKRVSYSSDGGATWTAPVSIGSGMATANNSHTYPGVALSHGGGRIYTINATSRESDNRVFDGPAFGVVPTLFESTDGGASFTSLGPLFTNTTYSGYNTPAGVMDAVVANDGKLLIVMEGGVESPQEGIVFYKK